MKKLVLFTISVILLGAGRLIAQTDNCVLQDKSNLVAEQARNSKIHAASNCSKPLTTSLHYRPLKHFRGIPVYLKDYGFGSAAKHSQQKLLPLRVYFAGNYTGKALNSISPVQTLKTTGATNAVINTNVLQPKESTECASVFGCSSDNGMNIGISKNTTLNVGIGYGDDDGGDSMSANNMASDYADRDMDISVSLLVGLR